MSEIELSAGEIEDIAVTCAESQPDPIRGDLTTGPILKTLVAFSVAATSLLYWKGSWRNKKSAAYSAA